MISYFHVTRINEFLKHRSPSASEYRPLSGLNPTTHARLALKDAKKVMTLQSNLVTSYILKANALVLLEKYELAGDVICSGLQIDPQNNSLLSLDRSTANTFTRRNHIKPQRTDDYDCTLYLKLLYEPITTPCGTLSADHAFFSLRTEVTDAHCVVQFYLSRFAEDGQHLYKGR
ncbi:UNVERIFIED_CONTAM: hypothetical protein Slati_3733600 [Sesamum latifolium]|uniref:Uncharacterized protein n=1 Tax=Sesamum latifolium TaxID=2727402 RepID=A0AAW2U3N3_9LAMI